MKHRKRCLALGFAVLTGATSICAQDATVNVDGTHTVGRIEPALFAVMGFSELLRLGDSNAVRAAERLNLGGTPQRLSAARDGLGTVDTAFDLDTLFPNPGGVLAGATLIDRVTDSGMEPILVLPYTVPFLTAGSDAADVIIDPALWTERAVQAVTAINGRPGSADYELRLRNVEIWNHPPTPIYFSGAAEQYFDLFNRAAAAIKAAHPEVSVGGPASLIYNELWTHEFIRRCGNNADYLVYHSRNESADGLAERLRRVTESFRAATGNHNARVMIAESDVMDVDPAQQRDYLLRRQFALLDLGNSLAGFHQENAVQNTATYWSYWIMRDLRGERLHSAASADAGLLSASARSDTTLSTVIYRPLDATPGTVELDLRVPPSFQEAMLLISRVGDDAAGIVSAEPLDGRARLSKRLSVAPGEACAVTLRTEAEDDLVWADLTFSRSRSMVGEDLEATARILNITGSEMQGVAQLRGIPQEWEIDGIDGSDRFRDLQPGELHVARYRITATAATPEAGSDAYVFINARPPRSRSIRVESVPTTVRVDSPVTLLAKPDILHTTAGYQAELRIYVTNEFPGRLSGVVSLIGPDGLLAGDPREITLDRGEIAAIDLDVSVSEAVGTGRYAAQIAFDYAGTPFTYPVEIDVSDFDYELRSTPVDLTEHRNVDGVSTLGVFDDYDQDGFGGRFSLPAQFMPDAGTRHYLGAAFDMPPSEGSELNLVEARGQTIPVPVGRYDQLYLIMTTVNSSKESQQLVANYANGEQPVPFQVTDWCVQAAYGEVPIMKAPHRHMTAGVLRDCRPQLFLLRIPLDGTRELQSIELPDTRTLYFVAMTLIEE